MINNKIAVLLPVYKGDNIFFFETSIGSILNQTHKDITVFVGVDGVVGSEMQMFLDSLKSQHNNVEIRQFSENRGLACVLNDLLRECIEKGFEYLARMDADDIALPERFEKQLQFLVNNPEIDVVGGAIQEIDEESKLRDKVVTYPATQEQCRSHFRYRDPLAHPAVMFRKTYFAKVKGYRPEYRKNQDTMLWYDGFMSGCKFANIPDVILHFRTTMDFYKNRRGGYKRAKKVFLDRMKINKTMKYGLSALLFASMIFVITLSPVWVKKIAYGAR